MAACRHFANRPARLAAVLALVCLALPVWAEFWETPQALAEGRFPSFFPTKAGPVLIWQESQSTGDRGSARIRFARYEAGSWKKGEVSDAPYSFTSSGTPPLLYSAAQARDGAIAVAIGATGRSIEIWLSRDGGRSFQAAGKLESSVTSVAPRIYPSATGGWIVFATQGRASSAVAPGGEGAQDQGSASKMPNTVSIYAARSVDGSSWSGFEPLVSEAETRGGTVLLLNFAPYSAPLGSRDIVVFQTYVLGEGELSSRYELMSKTSSDGGASWTEAKPITDFPDPSGGADAGGQYYDNQNPQLAISGGRLYAAWERRKAKAAQTQVWSARIDETGALDPKTAGPAGTTGGSFMLSELFDAEGAPALLSREDKLKANRILFSVSKDGRWSADDAELADRSDKSGAGFVAFARALQVGGRTFLAWQLVSTEAAGSPTSRIYAMVPDVSAQAPSLAPINFAEGRRSRSDTAQVRVDLPKDASGIKDYAYLWKKTADKADAAELAREGPSLAELWKDGVKADPGQASLSLPATLDGNWTLWASAEDRAGNRSSLASLSFYRKKNPPPAPLVMRPDTDEEGFLVSNSFSIRWIPPETDDLAGYTWDLAYAGPLQGVPRENASAKPAPAPSPQAPLPGLSAYESSLLSSLSLRLPPPGVRGTSPVYSADNVDDGYYVFTVSAIDTMGNISGASSILVKADKFRPYTAVALAQSNRDDLGRSVLRILGRGFLADGEAERVVLDRKGREPYDVDRSLAKGDYRLASDREIDGLTFEGLEAGSYRIGVFHSTRGWYWTAPIVAVDVSGTVKYALAAAYEPSYRLFSGRPRPFTIYDAIVLMAIAFAGGGILLSSRQVLAVAREGELVRREALALVTGGPMPQARNGKAARALRRRSSSLRVKFTLIIAVLVIFVVLLLAVSLGYNMVKRTSSDLAGGLDQRARVLLESVAQGGRFFLGTEDAVKSLSLFPTQAKAMAGADYITITGLGADPKVASGEVVYATNDDGLAAKLDPATLNADRAAVLGQSSFRAQGGPDPLAPRVANLSARLQADAAAAIQNERKLKQDLADEKSKLKADAAGNQRRTEINAQLDDADRSIRDILRVLSDQRVGSIPPFDPTALAATGAAYLYYKPILEYRPSDDLLYRGMVRLQVNTKQIAADVQAATYELLRLTLIIAAVALGVGIVGAFILSTVIVVPIRKLVAQIERIRDTEDKADLEGSRIEVASRDELYTLASTVNEMTSGLVHAAKASKELTVGKGIQKMFIPLSVAPGKKTAKLSTGRIDDEGFEVYGYYEGAKGVSGDYWDFRPINTRYHYFIKCDISGKGVSAALIMVEVATMVINYFSRWSQLFPSTIDLTPLVYQINNFINEMKYEGRFAAFTLGVLDAKTGVAYLCDAGDTKLHVWSGGLRELLTEDLPNSPAAGPFDSSLVELKGPYKQVSRPLASGDVLMLYTDGIEEAKRILRDGASRELSCAHIMDPAEIFAGYLRDYFGDERFQIRSLASPGGAALFSGTNAEAFASSFASELALGLAEISTDKITAAIRDEVVESIVEAVVEELDRSLDASTGPGGWSAQDSSVLAIAAGPKARSAMKKALEEAQSGMAAAVRASYVTKPGPSFMGESFQERLEQGLSSLGGKLLDELCKALEKKHHELDKERMTALLRQAISGMTDETLAVALPRLRSQLESILAGLSEEKFEARPDEAHLRALVRMPAPELAALLVGAVPGPCSPKAVAEIARIPSNSKSMKRFTDKFINSPVYHDHHKVGTDNEEFGQDRIAAVLKAIDSRSTYTLVHDHDPLPPGSLSFDFSNCAGILEDKVIALIAVEKIFRLWKDESTTSRDQIVIDEKVDDFLKAHFDQYRLYFSAQRPYYDPEKNNPGYRVYAYLKEDEQYDDLTILAIRRK